MRISRIRFAECDAVPAGWGLAWHDLYRQQIVVLPIPLNIIAGLARRFYLWLLYPWRSSMTKGERAAFERGQRLGRLEREALDP